MNNNKEITLKDFKKSKLELEELIYKELQRFEHTYGCIIRDVNLSHRDLTSHNMSITQLTDVNLSVELV